MTPDSLSAIDAETHGDPGPAALDIERLALLRPQVADLKAGPEPSWRQLARFYYAQHGMEEPDAEVERYFAYLAQPAASLDDATARIAYEAAGYVNWDRQPESIKDIHRRVAAAVLAHANDEAAAEIEALRAEKERLQEELAARPRWAGGQSPITCGPAGAEQIARAALENRHG